MPPSRRRSSCARRACHSYVAMPRRGGAASPVATARDKLVRGVLSPFNAVVITRRNLEEVLDDAVRRGRMTRTDAQDMIQTLVTRGARVTDDILAEIQRMLGNTEALETESRADVATNIRRLPISDYDELSAAQVQERLDGLSHVQLRNLREYEQRNANRKTVLE